MPRKLTTETESRMVSAIEKICSLVSDGLSPTAAAEKIARQERYGPDMIRLVSRCFNSGVVTSQRKQGSTVLEKLASRPLVDVEAVVRSVHPAQERTKQASDAVSDYYQRPLRRPSTKPPRVKAAAAASPVSRLQQRPADKYETWCNLKAEVEQLRTKMSHTQMALSVCLDKLAGAVDMPQNVRMHGQVHIPCRGGKMNADDFDWLCRNMLHIGAGKDRPKQALLAIGDAIADFVASRQPYAVKKSGDDTRLQGPIDPDSPACQLLKQAVDLLWQLYEEKAAYERRRQEAETQIATIRGRPAESSRHPILGCEMPAKQAAPIAHTLMGVSSAKNLLEPFVKAPDTSPQVSESLLALAAPGHEDELRRIRAKAMLHDLLTNDEIISGYSDQDVVGAYNELSQLSPRVAEHLPLVRSILRRWLPQGQLDTFEGGNVLDIEKGLQATQPAVVPSAASTWSPVRK